MFKLSFFILFKKKYLKKISHVSSITSKSMQIQPVFQWIIYVVLGNVVVPKCGMLGIGDSKKFVFLNLSNGVFQYCFSRLNDYISSFTYTIAEIEIDAIDKQLLVKTSDFFPSRETSA